MPTQEKIRIVEEMTEKFNQASSIIVTEYTGLDVSSISDLRRKFHKAGTEYRVTKNTLSRIAAKDAELPDELIESFSGQVAFVLGHDDPIAPAKILNEYLKKSKKPAFKSCYFEGSVLDEDGFKNIASLPGREELLGMLLGGLQDPMRKMVSVLQDPMRKILTVIKAVQEQKQS